MTKWSSLVSVEKEITVPACLGVTGNLLSMAVAGCWRPPQLTAKDGQVLVINVLRATNGPNWHQTYDTSTGSKSQHAFFCSGKPGGKGSPLAGQLWQPENMCFPAARPLLWGFDLVIWSQSPKPMFITCAIPSASCRVRKPKQSLVLAEKMLEAFEVMYRFINYASY